MAFSVQADQLHLLVEADEPTASRWDAGLAIRVAKAINRARGPAADPSIPMSHREGVIDDGIARARPRVASTRAVRSR
jgi:hypothetical protein